MAEYERHSTTAARAKAEMIIGLNAVVTQKKWYNMTVEEAVHRASKATAGNLSEALIAEEFASLVRSVGLEPLSAK
ncbi:MAG: hypothetical protein OXC60_18875 [Litoreibacter sp.]|nr:hypothetical protein [Litoreibacter sp.]MCY4336723.1 hypothetical protein [Litoreibacter sp.]